MHEYHYTGDHYILTIYYIGKKYSYKVKRYHSGRRHSYWHFYSKAGVQELQFDTTTHKLVHLAQPGQTPFPIEFMKVLQLEFTAIHKG